jgi:hypothetical protein
LHYGISPVEQVPTPPAPNWQGGRPFRQQYTITVPAFGGLNVGAVPRANRSIFQIMQQIAEHKPILRSIKVAIQSFAVGFTNVQEQLGFFWIGNHIDPLIGDKTDTDSIRLLDYYKPNMSNSGFTNPQDYLSNINVPNVITYLEVDVPINKQIDGNSLLALTAPLDDSTFVRQTLTLYFD